MALQLLEQDAVSSVQGAIHGAGGALRTISHAAITAASVKSGPAKGVELCGTRAGCRADRKPALAAEAAGFSLQPEAMIEGHAVASICKRERAAGRAFQFDCDADPSDGLAIAAPVPAE
jgi:hypothetical protein